MKNVLPLFLIACLTGCANVNKLYDGPERPISELSVVAGTSLQETSSFKENYQILLKRVNGKEYPSLGFSRVELLPGTYTLGFELKFIRTTAPTTIYVNEKIYEVPVELKKGKKLSVSFASLEGGSALCTIYTDIETPFPVIGAKDFPLTGKYDHVCTDLGIQMPGYSWKKWER